MKSTEKEPAPGLDSKPRFLRLPDVKHYANFSTATLYRLMASGRFPKGIKLGRMTVWDEAAVLQWIRDHIAQGGVND